MSRITRIPNRRTGISKLVRHRIIIAGDSAGGTLCVLALCKIRALGLPFPAGGALLSPSEVPAAVDCVDYLTADVEECFSV